VGQSLDRPAFTFNEINQNLGKLKQPDTFLFDRLSQGGTGRLKNEIPLNDG
jgi:putative ABC transport system permease protein